MTIVAPLPFTLANGTTADADQVMANLNQIRNDVNSNAAGGGGSGNVVGPTSAVDGHIAVFDGVTGKIIKDGGAVPSVSYRGASAFRSTNQSIPASTPTAISLDSEVIDTDSIHSTSVNPSRMTVPAGITKIRLIGQIAFGSGTLGTQRRLSVNKNGADYPTGGILPVTYSIMDGTNPVVFQMVSPVLSCIAGDYFQLVTYQTEAGSVNALADYTWFELQILG